MTLPFALAPIIPGGPTPIWDGTEFKIGAKSSKILQYSINHLGWNDELTQFHEESAGDHHFIDRASRDYAIAALKQNLPQKNPIILEVGCSSGFMLQRMQRVFKNALLIGSDVVRNPLQKLANTLPKLPLFRFDMVHCPLPDQSVDAVVMLNVLEHIEQDGKALAQAHRILKPGGVLIIEVPAGPQLYDAYDKVLLHYRRYTLAQLSQLVRAHHFKIKKASHLGFFLYPGFWWVKQRNKKWLTESAVVQKQQVEKVIQQTGKSKLLHALMQIELWLGKQISYPIGIRCLISCVKK